MLVLLIKLSCILRASEIHNHNTRYVQNGNFYTNSVRTTRFGLKGLQTQDKHLWEILPNKIKDCRTIKSFIGNFK